MIRSMTGFGRAELSEGGWQCGVELRSVNGRFLEVRFKLPNGLNRLEGKLKKLIKNRCCRGKIECTITLSSSSIDESSLTWNKPLLNQYAGLLKKFQEILGSEIQVTLGNLTNIKELIQTDSWGENGEEVESLLTETLTKALEELVSMREREGGALQSELQGHIATIQKIMNEVIPLTRDIPAQYATRLKENLKRLVNGEQLIEDRLYQEIAIMADRLDVTEEISRFNTHREHLKQMLDQGGEFGRKFDFLLQEINREANTLTSKCNDAGVSARMVDIKSELEKLREHIQNIE